MSRLANFHSECLNAVAHLFGHDVFIERGCTSITDGRDIASLPALGSVGTADGFEAWGLGLHAVVSRLRVHPKV